MPNDPLSIDKAVEILNDLVALDPAAMHKLCETRTAVNDELADHPTAQVVEEGGLLTLGMIGVLNAIFGKIDDGGKRTSWGVICARYDKDELIGFARTEPR